MSRLLIVFVLIVAVIAGLGFYRGWFRFSSNSDTNIANVTVSVDKDQIQKDMGKAEDKAETTPQQAPDE